MLSKIFVFLDGKKTIITAAIGGALTELLAKGYLTQNEYIAIMGVVGFFFALFLRLGVKKSGPTS